MIMRRLLAFAGVVVAGLVVTMAVANAQRLGGMGQGRGPGQGIGQGQGFGPGFGRQGGGPGGPGRGMFGRGGGPAMMPAGLDLTAAQQEQVKSLFESERDANQAGRQAIGEARQTLHAAIFANVVDTGAVAALQVRITAAEQAQLAREVQTQLTLAGILTPEQRAKMLTPRGPGRGGNIKKR
jgi:Spy/CpxP family protein refolding chaperone